MDHNIRIKPALRNDWWYEIEQGLCFIVSGGDNLENHAYTIRTLHGHQLRWINPKGVTLGAFCFIPWDFISLQRDIKLKRRDMSILYLVEGPTDALRLHLAGYLTVSLLGISLHLGRGELIAKLLVTLESITGIDISLVLIQDNDGPGSTLGTKISVMFPGTRIIRLPEGCKDICNVNNHDLQLLLPKRNPL